MTRIARRLLVPLLLLPAFAVSAQSRSLEIDIIGGNAAALPIAVVPFGGSCGQTDVDDVVRADLARSGQFRTLDEAGLPERPTSGAEVAYPTWRMLKQNYLLIGRLVDGGEGALRVEFELFNVASGSSMLALAMTGQRTAMRDVAHQVADLVYEKILNVRGAFWTRIAYVTSVGTGQNTQYALMVADSDGYNPQTVVRSREPLLSPAWAPDGRRLAYVSFERGNSSIYVQDLSTGSRELVSASKGINGGPAFSACGYSSVISSPWQPAGSDAYTVSR